MTDKRLLKLLFAINILAGTAMLILTFITAKRFVNDSSGWSKVIDILALMGIFWVGTGFFENAFKIFKEVKE